GARAHVRLGEREPGSLAASQPGEESMLLLVGAEKLQWLRHADGLMGAEQGTDRRMGGVGALKTAVVVDLAEAKASVLLGDVHAERTEVGKPFDHAGVNPGLALDHQRVDGRAEER